MRYAQLWFVVAITFVKCVDSYFCEYETIAADRRVSMYNVTANISTCIIRDQTIEFDPISIDNTPDATILSFKLKNNELEFLPENIGEKFPKLTDYDASWNSLKKIESRHFQNLLELIYINLKGNDLKFIPNDTFNDCKRLELIYLSFNKIKFLFADTFHGLPHLKDLELSGNELAEIPENLLKGNKKLLEFDADENKLERINATTFDHLEFFRHVYLKKNKCVNAEYENDEFEAMKIVLAANCTGKT